MLRHTPLLVLLLSAMLLVQPAHAGPRDAFPALPGWTHAERYQDDSPDRNGIVLSGGRIVRSSPVIAEVDGNAGNGNEVVVGGEDGRVYVYRSNGSLLWWRDVPIVGCANQGLINNRAAVGDLFGNGVPHVLIGYGAILPTDRACDGGVIVYRGPDGAPVWNFSQKAFDEQSVEGPEHLYGVITAPALADADRDGRMEVAFGGLDRNVYLLNADGSLRWYYHTADTVWSTPLFMNVDSDPQLELIVATDISANPRLNPPTHDGGFLHAFETAPVPGGRIPFQTGFIWRVAFDQVLYSSPLAADLLPNNPGLEIAIGSGCFFPTDSNDKRGRWIKIIRPSDGRELQTLQAPACVQSSPAVGDLDDDGQLEIVATVSGDPQIGGDGRSRIVAWKPSNPQPMWATVPTDPNSGSNDPFGGDLQSAVIADLDGNGSLEVIAANFWSVHVLNGRTGEPLTCQNLACGPKPSMFAWYTLKSTPAVGDVNNDGQLDIVIGGSHIFNQSRGHLYAWTGFTGRLNSPPGQQEPYSVPWPQMRRDAMANGVLVRPEIVASVREVAAMVSHEVPRVLLIGIASSDGSSIPWRAEKVSDPHNLIRGLEVNNDLLRVTLGGDGLSTGLYSAVIELRAPRVPSVPIGVSVRVVDRVFDVSIPLVRN